MFSLYKAVFSLTLSLSPLLQSCYGSDSPGCGHALPNGFHRGQSHVVWITVNDPVMGKVDRSFRYVSKYIYTGTDTLLS